MFVNTELLEFIRLKNPLSSVIGKYEAITDDCCKCPFCHSKTNSLNLFHDESNSLHLRIAVKNNALHKSKPFVIKMFT